MNMDQFFLLMGVMLLLLSCMGAFSVGAMNEWGIGDKGYLLRILKSAFFIIIAVIGNVEIVTGFLKAGYKVTDYGVIVVDLTLIVVFGYELIRMWKEGDLCRAGIYASGKVLVIWIIYVLVKLSYTWILDNCLILPDDWMPVLTNRFMICFMCIQVALSAGRSLSAVAWERTIKADVEGKVAEQRK